MFSRAVANGKTTVGAIMAASLVGVIVGIVVVGIVVVVGVVVVVVSQIGVKATWDGVISRDLATGARAPKSPPRRVHAHRT